MQNSINDRRSLSSEQAGTHGSELVDVAAATESHKLLHQGQIDAFCRARGPAGWLALIVRGRVKGCALNSRKINERAVAVRKVAARGGRRAAMRQEDTHEVCLKGVKRGKNMGKSNPSRWAVCWKLGKLAACGRELS